MCLLTFIEDIIGELCPFGEADQSYLITEKLQDPLQLESWMSNPDFMS